MICGVDQSIVIALEESQLRILEERASTRSAATLPDRASGDSNR
jgi:hypothetical protein